ncbi:class I SAM-dependent methyltransferase [Virgibacillus sp. YIM 98842]|jgi:16S rRNA (guanine1207-N2)-methyltransferase|uniref:class I SAM-dependent methyltransferase n=1 Tax=Virgibacillus sp. YIM 98842 TaxID=2663533 RepID=UPI0013DD33CB|nr:class I SAM-dependent methyltransferase [Virgibacillus sp. YIM 98842]
MTEHYFSQQPQSKSSPKKWDFVLKGKKYIFTSDAGVFSKNEVDPGSRLLIEKFYAPETAGDLLDLGCGYGPIGIALAGYYEDRHIVMADVNERALSLAEQNARDNGIKNVEFVKSDRFNSLKEREFASVISNPPIRAGKKVVHQMFEESKKALKNAGELWIVIQKKQGAPSAKKKLEQLFNEVEVVAKHKGYYIIRAINI